MEYSEEQLFKALKSADAAGDVEAAKKIAAAIKARRSSASITSVAPKEDKEMSWGDLGMDVVKSAGSGLRQGTEGLVGLPGDLRELAAKGAGWAFGEGAGEAVNNAPIIGSLPTAQQINETMDQVIGQDYVPQTQVGKYANTIASFAPAALAGPGSLARKAAMTAVPGVLSEAAGQQFEGTEAEPYARILGGVIGGGISAGKQGANVKQAAKSAPTGQQLKQDADDLFDQLRSAGIKYDANEWGRRINVLSQKMKTEGLRERFMGQSAGLLDEMKALNGKSPDFSDIQSLRQMAGQIARETRASRIAGNAVPIHQETAAYMIMKELDKFEKNTPFISKTPLPPGKFKEMTGKARDFALRNIKQRTIEDAIEKAKHHGSGFEWGLRVEFRKLLNSKRGMKLFKDKAERDALSRVSGGYGSRNALAALGKFGFDFSNLGSVHTLVPGVGMAGAALSGPLNAAALAGVGTGAKYIARKMAESDANKALGIARMGRKELNRLLKESPKELQDIRTRQLLTASEAVRTPPEIWVRPQEEAPPFPQ